MAILVAGGAGYIGSHVCKMLSARGYKVIVLDNLSHGYKDFVQWGDFILGDIGDSALLDLIFEKYPVEAVMHFCAFIEVGESVVKPDAYYVNNTANTMTLINAMKKHGIGKFIFSSTAAVYGMPKTIPIQEDDPKEPINPYGDSKYMVERILDDYDRAFDFKSIRFRYFNASGADPEGQIGEAHIPESHLIPLILDAALGKRDHIKIFGTDYDTQDGSCIRDYVHVNDLADAHIRGLEYLLQGGGTDYFNLGSGSGFSVREMIEAVRKVTGRQIKVVETERRPGDPAVLVARSTKAREKLGWQPVFSLEEIIKNAWDWHQKYQGLALK